MAGKSGARSRARNKSGQFVKRGAASAKNRARTGRGSAKPRRGTRGRARGRSRNGAQQASGGGTKIVYRYRAAPAAKNGRGRGSRGRRRARRAGGFFSRNPFTFKSAGSVVKELGYAGAGAFGVSTLSQLIPFPVTSPVMILIVQGILAYIVGWLGGKVLGKDGGKLMQIGGFAYAAGNFVNNQFPNLQQKILSFSPLRPAANAQLPQGAAAQMAAGNGSALQDRIMTTDQLSDISLAHPYMSDIGVVNPGQFGYGQSRWAA